MNRHPCNSNLRLHYEPSFLGLPVQTTQGPLIVEYLSLLNATMHRALDEHPRSFVFRADLRFPEHLDCTPYMDSSIVIERFFESFKSKIRHNRDMAKKKYGRAHDTTVRYVWAREVGRCGRPHFHIVIFLNNDAFCSLGDFERGKDNIFNRLEEAWARALGLHPSSITGLVEAPPYPCYYLRRGEPNSMAAFFERASYLCKAATKLFNNGCHWFGGSRC